MSDSPTNMENRIWGRQIYSWKREAYMLLIHLVKMEHILR